MRLRSPRAVLSRREALRVLARQGVGAACVSLVGACANGSFNPGVVGSITPQDGKGGSAGLTSQSAVKVVLMLPLSGAPQTAAVAKGLKQAAELALFERNMPDLQLLVKDDKGTDEGARAAAQGAVGAGAELIIGPLFAKSVSAAAPIARQAGIPVIAFSNDARVAGQGVYLLTFLAAQEVPRIVGYAVSQGRTRFAALLPEDAAGNVLAPLFKSAVEANGGSLVAVEHYPVEVNRMLDPVRRLRESMRIAQEAGAPVDVLFLPGGADTLPLIGPLLPPHEFDGQAVKVIGTGGWDYPNAGRERILRGGWFAAPDPRGWQEFSERFAKTYKSMPPRLASLAYDAIGVAAALAPAAKGSRYQQSDLTRPSGFNGVDGAFRFQVNGLSARSLAILEMQAYGPGVVEGASPASPVQQASARRDRISPN